MATSYLSRVVTAWLALVVGCGGGDESGDGLIGRGSVACQEWQDSVCVYLADRCHAVSRETCDEQYKGVTCKNDDAATACANMIDKAVCGTALTNCDLVDIADPAPARQACENLFSHFCSRAVECRAAASETDCLDEMKNQIDCQNAWTYTLSYEECLSETDKLSCSNLKMPEICQGVIKMIR